MPTCTLPLLKIAFVLTKILVTKKAGMLDNLTGIQLQAGAEDVCFWPDGATHRTGGFDVSDNEVIDELFNCLLLALWPIRI
jgi:hypothetical protein